MLNDYLSMDVFKRALVKSDIFTEDLDRVDGILENFNFTLPDNLVYVMHIHPKAFAHYLPEYVKEEFSRRTEKKFLISKITFECSADKLLGETRITWKISGKVKTI